MIFCMMKIQGFILFLPKKTDLKYCSLLISIWAEAHCPLWKIPKHWRHVMRWFRRQNRILLWWQGTLYFRWELCLFPSIIMPQLCSLQILCAIQGFRGLLLMGTMTQKRWRRWAGLKWICLWNLCPIKLLKICSIHMCSQTFMEEAIRWLKSELQTEV